MQDRTQLALQKKSSVQRALNKGRNREIEYDELIPLPDMTPEVMQDIFYGI